GLPTKRDEKAPGPFPGGPPQLESSDGAHHGGGAGPAQTPCANAQKVAARNSYSVRTTSDFPAAHLFRRARSEVLRVLRHTCWLVPGCRTVRERLCSRVQRSGRRLA